MANTYNYKRKIKVSPKAAYAELIILAALLTLSLLFPYETVYIEGEMDYPEIEYAYWYDTPLIYFFIVGYATIVSGVLSNDTTISRVINWVVGIFLVGILLLTLIGPRPCLSPHGPTLMGGGIYVHLVLYFFLYRSRTLMTKLGKEKGSMLFSVLAIAIPFAFAITCRILADLYWEESSTL